MRKNRSLLLFFLFTYTVAHGQTIQGKVVDEKTGEPIPYTSTSVVGTNQFTLRNESGDFEICINTFPVTLRFGHITYQLRELKFANIEKTYVKLYPANLTLREVVIGPKNVEKLLVEALTKAKLQKQNITYAKSFYRQFTTINNAPSAIYEFFYNVKWNAEGINGWNSSHSRFATADANPISSINNQSFLTYICSDMLLSPKSNKSIRLETLKDYNIHIDRYIEQKEQSIVVINYNPKGKSRKKMFVDSTYYIGLSDKNVYRLESESINLPNNCKGVKDFKTINPSVLNTVTTFKLDNQKTPILESTATKLNISFSSEEKSYHINVTSLLSIYQIDATLKKLEFVPLEVNITDKKAIESIKYDAEFWKNNSIVKRTYLEGAFIKMMERKQAFGTMTNL